MNELLAVDHEKPQGIHTAAAITIICCNSRNKTKLRWQASTEIGWWYTYLPPIKSSICCRNISNKIPMLHVTCDKCLGGTARGVDCVWYTAHATVVTAAATAVRTWLLISSVVGTGSEASVCSDPHDYGCIYIMIAKGSVCMNRRKG